MNKMLPKFTNNNYNEGSILYIQGRRFELTKEETEKLFHELNSIVYDLEIEKNKKKSKLDEWVKYS